MNGSLLPETQLLLCCGRAELDDKHRRRLRGLLAGPVDWERLLRLAKRHKLRPLLYRHLRAAEFPGVPLPIVQRLSDFARSHTLRHLALTAHLRAVLRLLEEGGIPALLLKGPAPAGRLYGDPALREFHDLDVWIERRHVPQAHMRLVAWGCRLVPPALPLPSVREDIAFRRLAQENVSTYLLPDGRSHLELHWALIPPSLGSLIEFEGAWSRRQPHTLGSLTVSALGDADLLVYLAAHGAKHRWQRLEWLCCWAELARQVGQAEWEQAWQIARRARAVRLLHLALALSSEIDAAPPPPRGSAAAACLPPQALTDAVTALWRQEADMEPSVADSLFYASARERFSDRLLCRARLALLPSFHDLAALPEPLRRFPLYLLVRPFRLLTKHSPHAAPQA